MTVFGSKLSIYDSDTKKGGCNYGIPHRKHLFVFCFFFFESGGAPKPSKEVFNGRFDSKLLHLCFSIIKSSISKQNNFFGEKTAFSYERQ